MAQRTATRSSGASRTAPETATRTTTRLLTCGVVAGPLFIAAVVLQVLTRAGFDLRRHPVSLLSLGALGWIQVANFVASGLLAGAFAVGVRRVLRPGHGATWGPLLLGAFGSGLVAAGVCVPDPAFGFPPGAPEGIPASLSLNAALHGVGFTLAFGSLTLACLVFARRYAALRQPGWAAYSVATATAGLALSMWPGQEGASVRYFAAAVIVWAWVSASATRLRTELTEGTGSSDAQIGPRSSRLP